MRRIDSIVVAIEKNRQELNELVEKKGCQLTSSEVLIQSQKLDGLILKFNKTIQKGGL